MSDKDELAARIREHVALDPQVSEKKMFGGIGFMLNGNMFLGVTGKGELMVRLGKDNDAAARARPGACLLDFEAKRMGGFPIFPFEALEAEDNLPAWVKLAYDFTARLPPK